MIVFDVALESLVVKSSICCSARQSKNTSADSSPSMFSMT